MIVFLRLIESPAILLILGTAIGFIPTLVINRQNNKHLETMFIREKKHETYINFLRLNEKIMTHNLIHSKDIELTRKLSAEIFELNEIVKSQIKIYSSKEINNIAGDIFATVNAKSEQEAVKNNKRREELFAEIFVLMRQDLGIDS